MKCPKCSTEGAYEPLLSPIECTNSLCGLYVKPKNIQSKPILMPEGTAAPISDAITFSSEGKGCMAHLEWN